MMFWLVVAQTLMIFGQSDVEPDYTKQEAEINLQTREDFQRVVKAEDPDPATVDLFEFAPTPIINEVGVRSPKKGEKVVMVDAALHAIEEILKKHPEALLYGQDVGAKLGGVFREAAMLAQKFGSDRVFNTPIQEAYIVGSTAGMSAVGAKPIVEIQFAITSGQRSINW